MSNKGIDDPIVEASFKKDTFSPAGNTFQDADAFGEAFKAWPQVVVSVSQTNKQLQASSHTKRRPATESAPAASVLTIQAPEWPAVSEQRSSQTGALAHRRSDAGVSGPWQQLEGAGAARLSTGGQPCGQGHQLGTAGQGPAAPAPAVAQAHSQQQQPERWTMPDLQAHLSGAGSAGPHGCAVSPHPAVDTSSNDGMPRAMVAQHSPNSDHHALASCPSTTFFDMLTSGCADEQLPSGGAVDGGPGGSAALGLQPAPSTRRPSTSLPPNLAALGKFVESVRSKQQQGGSATTSSSLSKPLSQGVGTAAKPSTSIKTASHSVKKGQVASASCASMEGRPSCPPTAAVSCGHTAHSVPAHWHGSPFLTQAGLLLEHHAGSSGQQTHGTVGGSTVPPRAEGRAVPGASLESVGVGGAAASSDAEWPMPPAHGVRSGARGLPHQQSYAAWPKDMTAMPTGRAWSLDYSYSALPYMYPPSYATPHPAYVENSLMAPSQAPHLQSHIAPGNFMQPSFFGGCHEQQRPWGLPHPGLPMMLPNQAGQFGGLSNRPLGVPLGGMGRRPSEPLHGGPMMRRMAGPPGMEDTLKAGHLGLGGRAGNTAHALMPQDDAVVAAGLLYRAFRKDSVAVMLPRSMQQALSEDFRKIHHQLVVRKEKRRQFQNANTEAGMSLGSGAHDSVLGSPMSAHARNSGGTQQEALRRTPAEGMPAQLSPLRQAPSVISSGYSWQSAPTGPFARHIGVDASPTHNRRPPVQPVSPSDSCPAVCTERTNMAPAAVPRRHMPPQHPAERAMPTAPAGGLWWPVPPGGPATPHQFGTQ